MEGGPETTTELVHKAYSPFILLQILSEVDEKTVWNRLSLIVQYIGYSCEQSTNSFSGKLAQNPFDFFRVSRYNCEK